MITSPMAQSVARQAVNLQVAGSNPAGGEFYRGCIRCRPVVRIPGFHPGDPGSNPGGGESFGRCSSKTQTAGFEPAHAEHTRLAGEPRNHLGTSAMRKCTHCGDRTHDH